MMADSAEMGLLMMLFESLRSTLSSRDELRSPRGWVDVLLDLHDDLFDPIHLLAHADEVVRLEGEGREANGRRLHPQCCELRGGREG
jgi:hypothetical protein